MPAKTKTMGVGPERRGTARASRVLAVRHRLVRRNTRRVDSVWNVTTSKNMSLTGLLFSSPVLYKVGDVLDVSVVLSGVIDIIKGPARVVRVREHGSGLFDVAVHFLPVKVRSRSAKKHA